jgi:hypothetical protein
LKPWEGDFRASALSVEECWRSSSFDFFEYIFYSLGEMHALSGKGRRIMAKATTTIRQSLNYQPQHAAWFAANQALYNRVVSFYFDCIQAHAGSVDLPNREALTALEKLTYATEKNPSPILPLTQIAPDVPAMFRRAAINAAMGSARAFFSSLKKWRTRQEKAEARSAR